MIRKVLLYYNTIRYLKWVQVFGRIRFKLSKPKIDKGLCNLVQAKINGSDWIIPPCSGGTWGQENEKIIFNLFGESLITDKCFWNDSKASYLSLYNRHYFDSFKNGNRGDWESVLELWIAQNPHGSLPGWEPYPLSLRIVNWISWHLATDSLSSNCLVSLAEQVRYLQKRIEYYLQGNHLFANAKALVFGGCFFEGKEADKWLKLGLGILRTEIKEQILSDGMNYEMSPMYHAIFLVDLLDLLNLSNTYSRSIPEDDTYLIKKTAQKMLRALKILTHPNGEIALFGDSSRNVVPETESIINYAKNLGLKDPGNLKDVEILSESKYIRLILGDHVLIIKAGNLGPDHLLAHAHADSLTFELGNSTSRLIVDMGVDRYGVSSERIKQRGTRVHNTVTIDGQNSSEVWSGFRVAKRASSLPIEVKKIEGGVHVECGHTGYHRLSDPVTHIRHFYFYFDRLEIVDQFKSNKNHEYEFNLYTSKRLNIKFQDKVLTPEESEVCAGFGMTSPGFNYWKKAGGSSTSFRSTIFF